MLTIRITEINKEIERAFDYRCLDNIRSQFHQHAPFAHIFLCQKFQSQNVTRKKLCKALSYEKFACKMLMKLTPGVKQTYREQHSLVFYITLWSQHSVNCVCLEKISEFSKWWNSFGWLVKNGGNGWTGNNAISHLTKEMRNNFCFWNFEFWLFKMYSINLEYYINLHVINFKLL